MASDTSARLETKSGLAIASVEALRLKLPYRTAVSFKTLRQSVGEYVILRLTLDNGLEGLAEAICRPEQSGEDATALAYQLEAWFKPRLIGADPLGHLALMADMDTIRDCDAAKSLIDIALWDL